MQLTDHISDAQLNEYLDGELADRIFAEAHLAVCVDCAVRLAALESLFAELDALPAVELTRSLSEASLWDAARFAPNPNLPPQLPRWLTLTATLQAALAVIVLILAAPFVAELVSPYLAATQPPSLTELLFRAQSEWVNWLDILSKYRLPSLPQFPPFEISNLMMMVTLAGVSVLWLVGNGLLLRNQAK